MATVPSNDGIDDPESEPEYVFASPRPGESMEEFTERFLALIDSTVKDDE